MSAEPTRIHSDRGHAAPAYERLSEDAQSLMGRALRFALGRGYNHIEPEDIATAVRERADLRIDTVEEIEAKAIRYMREGLKVRLYDGSCGPIREVYLSCVRPHTLRICVNDHGRVQHADLIGGNVEFL